MVERLNRYGIDFEWDRAKSAANLRKHGVSFEEAMASFADPFALIVFDPEHSSDEERWRHIGRLSSGPLLVTAYTHRDRWLRIIGCRTASARELHDFEEAHRRYRRHR